MITELPSEADAPHAEREQAGAASRLHGQSAAAAAAEKRASSGGGAGGSGGGASGGGKMSKPKWFKM